jgi:hypothetical protein
VKGDGKGEMQTMHSQSLFHRSTCVAIVLRKTHKECARPVYSAR